MSGEVIVNVCGGMGVWIFAILTIFDLGGPLRSWLNAMIERYRAKTEAIKHKNKEA